MSYKKSYNENTGDRFTWNSWCTSEIVDKYMNRKFYFYGDVDVCYSIQVQMYKYMFIIKSFVFHGDICKRNAQQFE
jgi:hypothetical protein